MCRLSINNNCLLWEKYTVPTKIKGEQTKDGLLNKYVPVGYSKKVVATTKLGGGVQALQALGRAVHVQHVAMIEQWEEFGLNQSISGKIGETDFIPKVKT